MPMAPSACCASLCNFPTSRVSSAPYRHPTRHASGLISRARWFQRHRQALIQASGSAGSGRAATAATPASARSAKEAVEAGLEAFSNGDAASALALFQRAMELGPNDDEARAALYNAACAHTKLGQWQPAVDAVTRAVNDYDLRLSVAMKDSDLQPLRERREWVAALAQMRGGIGEVAYSQLRAEAKAPFRLTRIIFLGGLAAGAGLGLLIIATRLVAALRGGEGAPDLTETLQNFAINSAALAALSFIVYRDVSAQRRDQAVAEREEELGQLQVAVSGKRTLPLAAFRGTARPVVVAGSRGQLGRALQASEPYYGLLRERGVCLVPIELSDDDPADRIRRLKAELQSSAEEGGSSSSGKKGFGSAGSSSSGSAAAAPSTSASASSGSGDAEEQSPTGLSAKDRRWRLEAAEPAEWRRWAEAQRQAKGVKPSELIWAQVQLDGTVRSSGVGSPPWKTFADDLPPLSDVRTKLMDGGGMS